MRLTDREPEETKARIDTESNGDQSPQKPGTGNASTVGVRKAVAAPNGLEKTLSPAGVVADRSALRSLVCGWPRISERSIVGVEDFDAWCI